MAPDVVWSGPVTYLPPPPSTGYVLGDLARLDDPRPARPAPPLGAQQRGADPRLFWSLSFALHRDAWLRTGGFCEDYVGYGGEDTDFGQVAVACGLELGWTGSARACHQHHESHDPPVRHTADIVRNGRISHDHWEWWPMTGWLEELEQLGLVRRTGTHWEMVTRPAPAPGGNRSAVRRSPGTGVPLWSDDTLDELRGPRHRRGGARPRGPVGSLGSRRLRGDT